MMRGDRASSGAKDEKKGGGGWSTNVGCIGQPQRHKDGIVPPNSTTSVHIMLAAGTVNKQAEETQRKEKK